LAQWHSLLLDNLDDAPDGIVEQIAGHVALAGPEQEFLAAQLAYRRNDVEAARKLITGCLRKLPGHKGFRDFAAAVGVEA
jgi:hypothetical protein